MTSLCYNLGLPNSNNSSIDIDFTWSYLQLFFLLPLKVPPINVNLNSVSALIHCFLDSQSEFSKNSIPPESYVSRPLAKRNETRGSRLANANQTR